MTAPRRRQRSLRDTRVLVTGGTGFLGSHLVRHLVSLGAVVHVFARARSPRHRLADVAGAVKIVTGDMRSRRDVRAAVEVAAPEIVFHLAAHGVDPRRRNPVTTVQTNVLGVLHLVEALRTTPYARLVNTGTCFEVARGRSPIGESAPFDPVNVYAASKTMAMQICHLEARFHGKSIVTVRPFTFFGPGEQPGRLIPSVIRAVLAQRPIRITAGGQTRDYTYVEDMADAFVAAAVVRAAGGVVHVGTGEAHRVRDIARRVRDILGSDVPMVLGAVAARQDDAERLCADPTRARRLLGWRPRVTFEAGIRRTAASMRQ